MAWRPIHFFDGTRPNTIIFHGGDGFYYHLNNIRENCRFAYLRCVKGDRGVSSCPGTAKALKNMMFLHHMHPHHHGPDLLYPREVQLRREIKESVADGNPASFGEIIQAIGANYDIRVRARLPAARLSSTLNKIRSQIRPPVPQDLGMLGAALLQDEYSRLTKSHVLDENMFAGICGDMGGGTISLVFITPSMQDFMSTRSRVFSDGTMRKKCLIPKCCQIFSVYGIWRHHGVPMLRALMLRKTEESYDVLLDFIKLLMPTFQPDTVMCDHELAQSNSWRKKFPHSDVLGCLYHFAVAVWRHAKVLGLHYLMQDEDDVCSIIRSACALAMLPTEEIEAGLEDLGWEARDAGWMPHLKEFFQYLDDEWVPRINTLSVFEATDRTNNIAESGNRCYNKLVKVSRPSIFSMLDAFVKLHDQGIVDIQSLRMGLQVSRTRKTSALRNDARIAKFSEDLQNEDITRLQFLHRASRRMQGVFQLAFPM